MRKQYHILNGDSLKDIFPREIDGDIIVARECLVDGDVGGKDLEDLYESRAKFLSLNYGGSEEEYYEKSVAEFIKIGDIDADSDINLWFEDDLFCQVNFWFIAYLITKRTPNASTYLLRFEVHSQYGFGGLSQAELQLAYTRRTRLEDLVKIGSLWKLYQNQDTDALFQQAQELASTYPFILTAVEAHLARIPSNEGPGRPAKSLLKIMDELGTEEFKPVFKEFCKREAIYGYGDLQVKRLLAEIQSSH